MKKLKYFPVVFVSVMLIVGLGSCGDDPNPKQVDVYLGGVHENTSGVWQAVIWKNGEMTALSTGEGIVYLVAVSEDGQDYYALGQTEDDAARFTLWKNGVATDMMANVNQNDGIEDLEVHNGDVYAVGRVYNLVTGNGNPAVWKNGVKQLLEGTSITGHANDIVFDNKDEYITGSIDVGGYKAVYWKNGVRVEVTPTGGDHWSESIAVSGKDVYLVGGKDNILGVYKNETFTAVAGEDPSTYGWSNEIIIDGSDVYVGGSDAAPLFGNNYACYWKNGAQVEVNLEGTVESYVFRLAKSSSNIYAVGWATNATNGLEYYFLMKDWKIVEPKFSTTLEDTYIESVAVAEY